MTSEDTELQRAALGVAEALKGSVRRCVGGSRRVAVAFSGGIDSSVVAVCAREVTEVFLCSGYARGSRDETAAAEGASALGMEFVGVPIGAAEVAGEAGRSGALSLMDRSLSVLFSTVSQRAMRSGAEKILLGQLADELFGGYAKYQMELGAAGEDSVRKMMEQDVDAYLAGGIGRDKESCSKWIEAAFPFADSEMIAVAGEIPMSLKIRGGVRKAVLREAALSLGVPESIASAPKKAAQYSSGVQKLLG